ncbi:hypothetical protein L3X38_037637 [Prunus dulcis]|uniref:Bet v I/Major latex protein domain-containing protein n=1 Tax=Prunus dulcis TaxID=3755 RepID=A0AAD4V3Q5_PRUDU|nr:hypothetical protein L3X38_037637 [Prunus dulcis]
MPRYHVLHRRLGEGEGALCSLRCRYCCYLLKALGSNILHGFIGTQIELKSPADKFYKIFKGQAHLIPNVSSGHIKGVQVHEGDWETHDSVKIWNYHEERLKMLLIWQTGIRCFTSSQ